jgi:AraC-like DNA-binding protein
MFGWMIRAYPLIRSSFLSEFPGLVRELGGPLEDILDEAGLSLEQIEQTTLLIPFESQLRALQLAADRCSYDAFGLELAQRQDIAVLGALSLLIMNCQSVEQGLRMFGKYLHYSVQTVQLVLREHDDLAYLVVDTDYDIAAESSQFWDHSAAILFSVTRILCGQSWRPRATYLRRPEPQDASRYSRYFKSPVAFDNELNGLVFDRAVLSQPISGSSNTMSYQLQAYLHKNFEGDFLEQVRNVINSLLPTHGCNAKTVADCMGYSLRTLQRRLQNEQTSFQLQMDQVRSELAISYLQVPHVSLTDIGELLGFAELSVFSRTFRRWFGITPSQWRARRFD